MRRHTLLVVLAVVLVACAPAPTELPPTATEAPPTNTPAPPTETPIPPTPAPNPNAEKILMEFSEAINEQSLEAALALFAEDASVIDPFEGATYEGKDDIERFLNNEIQVYEMFYKFSEFEVEGDDVTWTWFTNATFGNQLCVGSATMQGDQISFLTYDDCHEA